MFFFFFYYSIQATINVESLYKNNSSRYYSKCLRQRKGHWASSHWIPKYDGINTEFSSEWRWNVWRHVQGNNTQIVWRRNEPWVAYAWHTSCTYCQWNQYKYSRWWTILYNFGKFNGFNLRQCWFCICLHLFYQRQIGYCPGICQSKKMYYIKVMHRQVAIMPMAGKLMKFPFTWTIVRQVFGNTDLWIEKWTALFG